MFESKDFVYDGRDEIEDPLNDALELAGVGEVTGGGSGSDKSIIDVEVLDLVQGLAIIRRVLVELGVARRTVIYQNEPLLIVHEVSYECCSVSSGAVSRKPILEAR